VPALAPTPVTSSTEPGRRAHLGAVLRMQPPSVVEVTSAVPTAAGRVNMQPTSTLAMEAEAAHSTVSSPVVGLALIWSVVRVASIVVTTSPSRPNKATRPPVTVKIGLVPAAIAAAERSTRIPRTMSAILDMVDEL